MSPEEEVSAQARGMIECLQNMVTALSAQVANLSGDKQLLLTKLNEKQARCDALTKAASAPNKAAKR